MLRYCGENWLRLRYRSSCCFNQSHSELRFRITFFFPLPVDASNFAWQSVVQNNLFFQLMGRSVPGPKGNAPPPPPPHKKKGQAHCLIQIWVEVEFNLHYGRIFNGWIKSSIPQEFVTPAPLCLVESLSLPLAKRTYGSPISIDLQSLCQSSC